MQNVSWISNSWLYPARPANTHTHTHKFTWFSVRQPKYIISSCQAADRYRLTADLQGSAEFPQLLSSVCEICVTSWITLKIIVVLLVNDCYRNASMITYIHIYDIYSNDISFMNIRCVACFAHSCCSSSPACSFSAIKCSTALLCVAPQGEDGCLRHHKANTLEMSTDTCASFTFKCQI